MNKKYLAIALTYCGLLSPLYAVSKPIIAEYFGIWTEQNQTWDQKFRPDTPFNELNRLYICFGKLVQTEDGHFTLGFDGDPSHVHDLISRMKKENPTAEIFLTVGGNGSTTSYGGAANDPAFAENVMIFLKKHHLNGIDVDWEQSLVKTPLSNLLQNLGTTLHSHNMLVTLDVWPFVDSAYDMSVINQYVDQINIMSYGTGLSVAQCAQSYEKAGLLANKIIGGIETESSYNQFGGTVDTLGPNGTIAQKSQYALQNNLAGMMAWRMDNDYASASNPNYPTYQGTEALWTYMQGSNS